MTQHELIIEYVKEKGHIIPAKLNDKDRQFRNDWLGSETGKRCRELRGTTQGKWCNPYGRQMLRSEKEGKFEKYLLLENTEYVAVLSPPKTEIGRRFLEQWCKPKEVQPQQTLFN